MTYNEQTGHVNCDVCGRPFPTNGGVPAAFPTRELADEGVAEPFIDQPWMTEDGKHYCLAPCFPGDEEGD